MSNIFSLKTFNGAGLVAPGLLFITGSLLAVTIILSRLATDNGAPILWFLVIVMAAAGLILMCIAAFNKAARGDWNRRLIYSIGAGAFQALTMTAAYLSVAHVGVGYVTLALAFPLLITYLLALSFGMERVAFQRALGVLVALAGGLLIALSKFHGLSVTGGAFGWVAIASAIPIIVAGGNLYRTQFWPDGAPPILLAALTLLLASLMIAPIAYGVEGGPAIVSQLQNESLLILIGFNIAAFALKFVAYFELQRVAGPVYLSQIGLVSAAIGTTAAVLLLGETLPPGFAISVTLMVIGVVLFQSKGMRQPAKATLFPSKI